MFKRIKLISQIIIVVIIIGSLGYYFYLELQKKEIAENPKADIIREINSLKFVNQNISEAKKKEYQEKFQTKSDIFLKGPENVESFWPLISMAQIKELVGDYRGSEQILLWALRLQPKSLLAHGNLANLYFHHLEEFTKAEEHYLKAIKPQNLRTINYYLELHEIYRYFYKTDTDLAENILKQGIEKYPEETNLMAVLAHYYKGLDRKEEAREYYQKILEINPNSQVAQEGLRNL